MLGFVVRKDQRRSLTGLQTGRRQYSRRRAVDVAEGQNMRADLNIGSSVVSSFNTILPISKYLSELAVQK
jgi:hypothetical protein